MSSEDAAISNTDKLEKLVPEMYKTLPIDQAYNSISDSIDNFITILKSIRAEMEDLNKQMEDMVEKL
jgi:predicted  nucleic acid-binding Zn-ribbon protein